MGQKVNPVALRVGVMEGWKSRWYSPKKEFADLLVEDAKIREFIKKHKEDKDKNKGVLSFPGVAKIEIERTRDEVRVIITTARPGLLIGRKGEKIEELQAELQNLTGRRINLKIEEEKNPELVAQLVAEDIGDQLVKRASFRRVIKHAMSKAMEKGAKVLKFNFPDVLAALKWRVAKSKPRGRFRFQLSALKLITVSMKPKLRKGISEFKFG